MLTNPPAPAESPALPPLSAAEFWRRWLADRDYFLRLCIRWLRGNRHDAEDVVSRGSLRAFEYLRTHPGGVEKFRPWALRILRNLCIDTVRIAGRCVDPEADDDDDATPCHGALPDRAVYCDELKDVLSGAFASLPPRLSNAFRLRFLDDLAYDEICQQLAITPENARKRIQQARQRLRGRLEDLAVTPA